MLAIVEIPQPAVLAASWQTQRQEQAAAAAAAAFTTAAATGKNKEPIETF